MTALKHTLSALAVLAAAGAAVADETVMGPLE